MKANPVLRKLGFSDDDRVVIIHTDDIGMCQASVSAFLDLWDFGLISSGATMVPCPWFLETAKSCRENTSIDMGVHVTLTSEWETYRWGPISTSDPDSGLIDSEGCFYHTTENAQEYGDPNFVHLEIQAQIERAIQNGINPTHIDTHMGAVGSLKFIPSYLQLAVKNGLPPMLMRLNKEGWIELGFNDETATLAVNMVNQLEEEGIPLVDRIAMLELDRSDTPEERIEYAKDVFNNLGSGITHFIIHPSKDTPELRAITADCSCRVADYHAFRSDDLRDFIISNGFQVIGYKALRELM